MKIATLPNYNEFERFLFHDILGNNNFNYGAIYDFDRIVNSFIHAEESLISRKNQKVKELEGEDPEVRYHMENNDFEVMNILNPEIQILRNSLCITLHSQFEKLWIDILEKYKECYGKSFSNFKINYVSKPTEKLIEDTLNRHRELFGYSKIRDSYAHRIDNRRPAELTETIHFISNKTIDHTTYNGNEFEILDMTFGREYSHRIFSFIQDLLDTSFASRPN